MSNPIATLTNVSRDFQSAPGAPIQHVLNDVSLTILPGETVGEMHMIDPQKASADVEIIERADIWTIDDDQFTHIVQTDPHAAFLVLKWLGRLLCRRLRANADKMLAREELTRQTFREMDY